MRAEGRRAGWWSAVPGLAALVCAGIALLVLVWGRVDCTVGGLRIRIGQPDGAVALGLLFLSAQIRWKQGAGLRKQLRMASDFLERHDGLAPFVLAGVGFLMLARVKGMQHWTFHTDAYDLALFDTAVRNTLQGRFLFADQLGRNFFSEHFSPILLLFCPSYLLADTPLVLLIGEALVVAAGTGWLYRLARLQGLSPLPGVAVALLYLNHPYVAASVLYDFHSETLGATFLLGAIYYLRKGAGRPYWICLLLALACKEDVPLYAAGLGVHALFCGRRGTGIATCLLATVWAVAAWKFIIPFFGQSEVSPLVNARWHHLGDGYAAVALALLRNPGYVLSLLCSPAVFGILLGFGFIPLLGAEVLVIAAPGVILNASSSLRPQADLQLYYAALVLPFAAWALVIGLVRLRGWLERVPVRPAWRARLRVAGASALLLAAAGTFGAHYSFHAPNTHVRERRRIMRLLPPGVAASCEGGFVPHLVRTHAPYLFPVEGNRRVRYQDCDYILVDRAGDPWPLGREELGAAIDRLRARPKEYPPVAESDGIHLFRNAARVGD